MSVVLFVGADGSLLEGLSQTVSAAGHVSHVARSMDDALRFATASPPLLAIIDRACLGSGTELLRVQVARGGAVILYRTGEASASVLPATVQRGVLADLLLPLERTRLVALLHSIAERSRHTGADRAPPDSEARHDT